LAVGADISGISTGSSTVGADISGISTGATVGADVSGVVAGANVGAVVSNVVAGVLLDTVGTDINAVEVVVEPSSGITSEEVPSIIESELFPLILASEELSATADAEELELPLLPPHPVSIAAKESIKILCLIYIFILGSYKFICGGIIINYYYHKIT
jgi:hypothetical protein